MSLPKKGSPIKVTAEGWCKGKTGRVEYLAPDAPKSIGVIITDIGGTVWCSPDQIEEVKKDD